MDGGDGRHGVLMREGHFLGFFWGKLGSRSGKLVGQYLYKVGIILR